MAKIPIHLTASTVLAPGSTQSVNKKALQHPLGRPMEIHEIKFQLVCVDLARITGGSVGVQIKVGSQDVTRGFVPIWAMCRSTNETEERVIDTEAGLTIVNHVVRLSKPMWVPPYAKIDVQFAHRSQVASNITARVSFSGNTLDGNAIPNKIAVPYFACFASKAFDAYNSADADQSSETDLSNGTGKTLLVDRLVGRIGIYLQTTGSNFPDMTVTPDFGGRMLRVRMADSNGDPIIQQFTRFENVFAKETRSWEVPYVMDPGTFVGAYLDKLAPTTTAEDYLAQVFIGLVGSRLVTPQEMK